MTPRMQFDAATHTYTLDGQRVPSVTQVLSDLLPGWQADEWYLQRGTAVHACAAMVAQGLEFTHDPQIQGQVEALRRFFREVEPDVVAYERRVFSAKHGYAGTLDLLGSINGTLMVLDYKASIPASVPYQLAAYAMAYGEPVAIPEPRYGMAVQITDDGTYRLSGPYDLKRYRAGWLALLGAHNIRRECGITKEQ